MSNASAKIFWLWLLLARSLPSNAATYERDIKPLLERHCISCHSAGQGAPFSFDSYNDAASRARLIAAVTRSRAMPPFKATALSLPFHGENRLTPASIQLFADWARAGAPLGSPVARKAFPLPPPPLLPHSWSMRESADLPASGKDVYRCFVVPTQLSAAQWIDAFRFIPGNPQVVHHALFFFDVSGAARKLDAESPEPGYSCFGSPGFLPASSLGGWSPGNRLLEMPAGTAVRAPKDSDLVFQIHYRLTGKPERDRSSLAVRFADKPPTRRLLDIALTTNNIDIPPYAADHRVRDRFEVPVDVTLWQLIPHAHFLARRLRAWATLPGSPRRVLLAIDDWDFNWQDIYRLRQPLKLPTGTVLEMEISYDNTARNVRNPHHPPRRVTWGYGTDDEMAGMHFNVTVDNEAQDLSELSSYLWGKLIRGSGIGLPRR